MSTLKTTYLQHPSAASPNLTLTSAGNVSGAGLDLITTQTFSAASAVNVNNCFSSAYENYLISVTSLLPSAGNNINIRLRVAGSDASAANYFFQQFYASGTTVGASQSSAQSTLVIGQASTSTGNQIFCNISAPALAAPTLIVSQNNYGGGTYYMTYTGSHSLTTAYDGFTLYPASGTFTGTLRVHGYRN